MRRRAHRPRRRASARQAISRRLASAGIADPGDLKSPRLPGALPFAIANQHIWGIHLARLGKSTPGLPTGVWFTGNSRPVRLKTEQPWECKSPHADQFGMSTGQACRASVLTSACLRASGASPRHSATACSSKRTGGFIPRIALDECRVREHHPARRPFVPIAQNTERARPKRQVAGESPAGGTTSGA